MAAAAVALAGCLPAGNPPAGRHLLRDRTLTGVFFSPSETPGVASYLLVSGPLRNPSLAAPWSDEVIADVYAPSIESPADAVSGLADLAPAVEDMEVPGGDPTNYTFATDFLGRLIFLAFDAGATSPQAPFALRRFDCNTGTGQVLRSLDPRSGTFANPDPRVGARPFLLSPGRTQLYAGDSASGHLFGPTTTRPLWQASDVNFVGEDFYGVASLSPPGADTSPAGTTILRIRPDAEPEVLLSATGQLGFVPILGAQAPQLLQILHTDLGDSPFALLDTETLASTALPTERGYAEFISASPSGQRLLFRTTLASATPTQPADHRLFIFDWTRGTYALVDAALVGKGIGWFSEWRPGTNELWFTTLPDGFATWTPENGARTFAATLATYPSQQGIPTVFSQDGAHWFSSVDGAPPALYVGQADAPGAPSLRLNPPGTQTERHWETEDGRLLVEAWATDPKRSDIYLVDADAGSSRPLASVGHLVTVGRERALALLDWQLTRSSGQLALLDFASGARTVLAEDVHAVDVDRGQSAAVPAGADVLAPSTRVAFLTRHRLEAPEDGLWVAVLP